jgi:hypothetical protein
MNSHHLIVCSTLNRTVSSWESPSARGHSRTLKKSAYSAPHAPYKLESRSAFGELRTEFRRPTSNGYARKRLRLRTSERQNSVLKATSRELNSVGKTASPGVYRKQFPRRVLSVQVAELNPSAGIQRVLCIVQCLRRTIPEHEIRAQLRFQLRRMISNHTAYMYLRLDKVQRRIDTPRLTEAPQLPLVGEKRPRSVLNYALDITPAQH